MFTSQKGTRGKSVTVTGTHTRVLRCSARVLLLPHRRLLTLLRPDTVEPNQNAVFGVVS